MEKNKCKICRRLGVKLFLKGEKCSSPKCPMVRKPYPPGLKGKRRKKGESEYGRELKEKQKIKNWYNLRERQLKIYVSSILKKRGSVENVEELLIRKLESRLDNVVFRLGFAVSRSQARQLVSHGHFLVNGKKVNIPSYQLKKGDKVTLKESSKKKKIFQEIIPILKKHTPPSWLKLDVQKMEGEVIGEPSLKEVSPPFEISSVFEFYSK